MLFGILLIVAGGCLCLSSFDKPLGILFLFVGVLFIILAAKALEKILERMFGGE